MVGIRTRGWLRSTAAAGVAGLVLGSMAQGVQAAPVPGPELEYEWERGNAGSVLDGDTLYVGITSSSSGFTGTQRVRTIGINAPEVASGSRPAQCGAAQAERALRQLAPSGTPLQLRARESFSYDDERSRIVRSIYAQDDEGNWFDTARQLVSDGLVLWFPRNGTSIPEYAHNLEYRVLTEDAAAARRGLWGDGYCGGSPVAALRVAVSYDQSVDGHEKVFVINDSDASTALGGWTIRDAALNMYRFPAYAFVPGRGSIEVRLANGTDNPGAGIYFAGDDDWFDNLPADNIGFFGDAAYLMDNAGSLYTGNLRSWGPYPCNPEDCRDPLNGALKVATPTAGDWSTGQDIPSAPRQVGLSAGTSKDLSVTWLAPTYVGDAAGITQYRVRATSGAGTTERIVNAPTTSLALTGLAAGAGFTVSVAARNAQGWSADSAATGPVTTRTAPPAPEAVAGFPLDGALVAAWDAPDGDGGSAITGYTAVATANGTEAGRCSTTGAEQSCVITPLNNGTSHTVTVTSSNAAGTSPASEASTPVKPGAAQPADPAAAPGTPLGVRTTPRPGSAVVVWSPPDPVPGAPVSGYIATATVAGQVAGSCQTASALSCVIPALADGTTYDVTVVAQSGPNTGAASVAVPVTPAPDARLYATTGPDSPKPAAWTPRETIKVTNLTGTPINLTGYALWDKDARSSTDSTTGVTKFYDTPDYVFTRGTTVPAGATLRVRSGAQPDVAGTTVAAGPTLLYTGKSARFTPSGDRIELAHLNKAQVDCAAWGGVSCAGQRPVSIPTQPVGVTAQTTASSVTVRWGAPISRGGTDVTGYTATAYSSANPGEGVVLGTCSTDGGGRACSIPGAIGTRYYAEVVAHNAVGSSPASAPRVQAAPRTVPGAPGSVSASRVPGGVGVTWAPAAENGAAITGYRASAYSAATGGSPVGSCTTSTGAMRACTITGLWPGRGYFIEVTARNRAGTGSGNSPRAAVAAGEMTAVSTYSGGRVTVRWDAPEPTSTVTGYVATLYTKASGGKKVGECRASAGATSCRTKKMKKRSAYYISLTMLTADGSYTVKPRIKTGPPKKASAPKVTSATPASKRVQISWAPPTFNGYSYLKGYGARLYSKSKGGKVKASCSAGPSVQTCTTKSMKKGSYWSAVRVKNSKGWSSWSKRVKVVVR